MKILLTPAIILFAASAFAQSATPPLATLPTKLPTSVTSTTAKPPVVTGPIAPTTPAAPATASAPALTGADLAGVLTDLANAKDPAAAANSVGAKLTGMDIAAEIKKLGNTSVIGLGSTMTLKDLAEITKGTEGALTQTMTEVFNELKRQYADPTISALKQKELYNQMKTLQELMKSDQPLKAALAQVKSKATSELNAAGLGGVVGALDDVIKGKNLEAAARTLAGTDWAKLDNTLKQLGGPGLDGLKDFLPPGISPDALKSAMGSFAQGGIDGVLADLERQLKSKLTNAIPKDMAELKTLLDKIGALRKNPSAALGNVLGGLFKKKTPPTSVTNAIPADCKQSDSADMNELTKATYNGGALIAAPSQFICD